MASWLSTQRLSAVLAKEFIQMRRDRVTFAMMLGVPLMQLILFGYAINNDPRGLPAALVDNSRDHYSRAVVAAMETSGYYRFVEIAATAAAAEDLLARGGVAFVVTIPSDFGKRVDRNQHPQLLVEADASDPAASSNAIGALNNIVTRALARQRSSHVVPDSSELEIVVHRRYNPEGISQYNIVPGLLGVILQMTMVMMTSMALTRESERGTMENLLAMPATPTEIMLGKILPYLVVGAVQVVVVLGAARLLFSVPFLGSLTLLLTGVLIFVLSLVMLGYAISTVARTQMQAMQLTFFFFLPSLLLSGFMFPYRGMPAWAQVLGEFFPLTHFLRVIRALMLKGSHWHTIHGEMWVLVAFVIAFTGLALVRFRNTLD